MRKHLLLAAGLVGLLAPAAIAQNGAEAELYTRVDDGEIRAAVVVRIDEGWHLYDTQRGHPQSVSQLLEIDFGGEGIDWSEPRLPEPEKYAEAWPEGSWGWVHYGRITIHALGTLAEGANGADANVSLNGQICEDASCVPYSEDLETLGRGSDRYFKNFPADLVVAAVDFDDIGRAGLAGGSGGEDEPEGPTGDWTPSFGEEQHVDARLLLRVEDGAARAMVQIAVQPEWHIYHGPAAEDVGSEFGLPTRLTLEGAGFDLGAPVFPEPQRYEDVDPGEFINGHEGTILVRFEGTAEEGADPGSLRVKIDGQVCDPGVCVQFELEREVAGRGSDDLFDIAAPAAGLSGDGGASESEGDKGLLGFLLLAVFWGAFTLLMPCTYPMIPITISFFTKQAIAREGKVLPLALTYGAGIVAVFVLIGVLIGPPIIAFATHPVTNIVIGSLFLFFALVLFGVVNMQPPAFLLRIAGKASRRGGYAGVFLMGVTLVVTSFTCTAPFVGSLLAVGSGRSLFEVTLGMGVFGLTMATPFVMLSLLPGKMQKMPQAGEWMHVLKVFLGFIEIAAALKFFSNSDLVWGWGLLSREVFLVMWVGIFLCAAMFLFGRIHLKGESEREIGPVRMVGGLGTLLFALYCGLGVMGFVMDDIMTAIIPPYSSERIAGFAGPNGGAAGSRIGHSIVKDDYAAALAEARRDNKLLLVNFTGFT